MDKRDMCHDLTLFAVQTLDKAGISKGMNADESCFVNSNADGNFTLTDETYKVLLALSIDKICDEIKSAAMKSNKGMNHVFTTLMNTINEI